MEHERYPYVCYERSTDCLDHIYPPNKKTVRTQVSISGNMFEPVDHSTATKNIDASASSRDKPISWACRFTALGDSNPGGNVPASAVNFVINTVPGQVASKLKKQCKKLMAERGIEPNAPGVREKLRYLVEHLE